MSEPIDSAPRPISSSHSPPMQPNHSLAVLNPHMKQPCPQRHPDYYYGDGSDIFLVENTLYRLHRGIISRVSTTFADMFSLPQPNSGSTEGQHDDHPIVLTGVTSREFNNLLSCLLPEGDWKPPPYDQEVLVDVLRLSALWAMDGRRAWALHYLNDAPLTPVLRMHLAMRYGVPDWIGPAFKVLVYFPVHDLSDSDASALGTKVLLTLMKAQSAILEQRKSAAAIAPKLPVPSPHLCSNHQLCVALWENLWVRKVSSRLNHPHFPIRCNEIVPTVEAALPSLISPPSSVSASMTPRCREAALETLRGMDHVFAVEESVIAMATESLVHWCEKQSPFNYSTV